ncbi:lipid asymmetry maintenance protein MlaB, partial [Nitrospirota bacterium]
MGIGMHCSGESCIIKVDGEVMVRHLDELRDTLLKAMDKSSEIVVDANDVEAVDVAVLQLFCAAHKSAVAKNKVIKFMSMSAPVAEVAMDAGFTHDTGC